MTRIYNFKFKILNSRQGFTLIESIVATALFAFVVSSIVGVYLSTIQLDRKTRAQRAVAQNARFIIEFLAKEVRNGSINYPSYAGGTVPANNTDLYVLNQASELERIFPSNNNCSTATPCSLSLTKNGTTSSLTSNSITITQLKFYIQPVGNPLTISKNYSEQPRVTMNMELTSNYGARNAESSKMKLQTTFTLRSYVSRATPPSTDVTPPAVTLTAPANGAVVAGTIAVSATASDNVGVAGVQFKLDGADLGADDTTAPYSISFNTNTVSDGSHILVAVARDAGGNTTTSNSATVTVANPTILTYSLGCPSTPSTAYNLSNGPLAFSGAGSCYTFIVNKNYNSLIKGAAGGGGGGRGNAQSIYGNGGGGGGGGAANISGTTIPLQVGVTYEARVGAGGGGDVAGTMTQLRISGSSILTQLNGGAGATGDGGAGGTVSAGGGSGGGSGGNGGIDRTSSSTAGNSGVTGGGGAGGAPDSNSPAFPADGTNGGSGNNQSGGAGGSATWAPGGQSGGTSASGAGGEPGPNAGPPNFTPGSGGGGGGGGVSFAGAGGYYGGGGGGGGASKFNYGLGGAGGGGVFVIQ